MCAILGYVFNDVNYIPTSIDVNQFQDSLNLMSHRGPDNSTIDILPGALLGHNRLSIIDLSDSANQPFYSKDKRYSLVYNGEIFNFVEIRQELIALGYQFFSNTDTEVLLNSYFEWGHNCLDKFNGMFAFLIYDTKENTYFAARDHFGIKPIYYSITKNGIIFSSEIKPLLSYIGNVKINHEYLSKYIETLSVDYGNGTLFNDVYQLEAGHFMSSLTSYNQNCWFNLENEVRVYKEKNTIDQIKIDYKNYLWESIKLRLRSDVKLAVTLSGGLDSSAVYAISSKLMDSIPPTAFSVKSNILNSIDSEFETAAETVKLYNGNIVEVMNTSEFSKHEIYKSLCNQEMPTWSLSHVLYDRVYNKIRENGIKVLLEGHGNDEILGGYPTHISECVRSLIINGDIKSALIASKIYSNSLYKGYSSFKKSSYLIFLGNIFTPLKYIYQSIRYKLSEESKVFPKRKLKNLSFKINRLTHFQNVLLKLVTYQIVPTVLRTFDRSTMSASIEMRPPFMDPKVVICSISLPDTERVGFFGQKHILRSTMIGMLPDSVLLEKVKRGFTADIRKFILTFTRNDIIDLLSKYSLELKINSNESLKVYDKFCSNSNDWESAQLLNKILSLLIWCDLFIGENWKKYK
jgi:asparagine synthase (glutamine-hydrolysing)